MIEIVLGLQYPRSIYNQFALPTHMAISASCRGEIYLHGHQSVIDQNLFSEEIGSDSCLIASAELLVDLWATKKG